MVLSLCRRDRNRMDSRENDNTWWYRTPSLFITVQRVTPLLSRTSWQLAIGDSGTSTVLTRYESMRLWSLRQSERTIARDSVQDKRWTYPCHRAVNMEHNKDGCADGVRRLTNIWKKVIYKEGRLYWRHINVWTPVNKAMSEISNCCHYFLSNPCTWIWEMDFSSY